MDGKRGVGPQEPTKRWLLVVEMKLIIIVGYLVGSCFSQMTQHSGRRRLMHS